MLGIMGAAWRHPVAARRQQDVAGRQQDVAGRQRWSLGGIRNIIGNSFVCMAVR